VLAGVSSREMRAKSCKPSAIYCTQHSW